MNTINNLENEDVQEIANSVLSRQEKEKTVLNKAIGRVATICNGEEKIFWITNREYLSSSTITSTITGKFESTEANIFKDTLTNDGTNATTINKNTILGLFFSQHYKGDYQLKMPNGVFNKFTLFNRSYYRPFEYPISGNMAFAKGDLFFDFNNIKEILDKCQKISAVVESDKQKLKELQERICRDKQTDLEEKRLRDSIEKRNKEIRESIESIGYIRKNATLQFQPNLDSTQTNIKVSNLFDGESVIIDGGPGTGKTTTLIQRLKYLIDHDAINEEGSPFNITPSQKEVLFDENRNWMFFSPSELLRQYLKNSMDYEGLTGLEDKVRVWDKYRLKLMSNYKLFNPETEGPFQKYRGDSQKVELYISEHYQIIKAFHEYYLNYHKEQLTMLSKIKTSEFKWHSAVLPIKATATKVAHAKKMEDLILLYLNLSEAPSEELTSMLRELSEKLSKVTIKIQNNITKDKELSDNIETLLLEWNKEKDLQNINIQNKEYEAELEETEIEESEINEIESRYDYQLDLNRKLKSLIKKKALSTCDPTTRLSAKDKALFAFISEELKEQEIEDILSEIGQSVFYQRYFERFTKGIERNLLSSIPLVYKSFRIDEYKSSSDKWNLPLLKEIVTKDSNKRLHSSEQSFLIGFINNLLRSIYKKTKTGFKNLKHIYAEEYKECCRPVIGIDEVTDFSIIDIFAMHSLSHYDFSSITLCGDPMQRLTQKGIRSWNEISTIIPNNTVMELKISYRQSPTLLNLARRIYKDTLGYDPKYKAHLKSYPDEPVPLLHCSSNEDENIKWIARRIIDVFKIYGLLPSIAIFIDNKDDIPAFVSKLTKFEDLEDNGIEIKDCSSGNFLESKDTVRVFPIDVVKGLEFQVVFFHNIDKFYFENASDNLMEKFLYVGLSRAAFFLGATISDPKHKSITKYFESDQKYWKHEKAEYKLH